MSDLTPAAFAPPRCGHKLPDGLLLSKPVLWKHQFGANLASERSPIHCFGLFAAVGDNARLFQLDKLICSAQRPGSAKSGCLAIAVIVVRYNQLIDGSCPMSAIRNASAVVLFSVSVYRLVSGDSSALTTGIFLISATTLFFAELIRRKKLKQKNQN